MASVLIDGPERVARGAALLDQVKPDWPEIVIEANGDLDIKDCAKCVLGRCFGDYVAGLVQLSDETGEIVYAPKHGFNTYLGERDSDAAADAAYAELRDLWLAEARRRRDNPA